MKEQRRETSGLPALETVIQDLRYAYRTLRRDVGSTMFAILITGIGIGASSTMFSVVNALLLRPLPFRDPGRLVWISNAENYSTQAEHYADLRDQNQSFNDLAGYSGFYRSGDKELIGTGEAERLTSVPVTENFFTVLGSRTHNRKVVYEGGVRREIFRPAGNVVEQQLLAQAVCFGYDRGGPETNFG